MVQAEMIRRKIQKMDLLKWDRVVQVEMNGMKGPEDGLAKGESSGPSGSEWNEGPENGLSEGGKDDPDIGWIDGKDNGDETWYSELEMGARLGPGNGSTEEG